MAEDVGTPVATREVESRFRNQGSAIVGTEPRFCEVDPSSAKKGITIRKLNTRSVNGSRFALPCQLGLICMHAHLMVGEPSSSPAACHGARATTRAPAVWADRSIRGTAVKVGQ